MTRSLFASLLTCGLLLTPAAAQRPGAGGRPAAPEKPPALGQAATGRIVYSYENAGHWAMRAILLLSLGTDWHPDGLSIVRAALADKDDRLPPFAIETLLAADDRVIAAMATPETIAALIDALRSKNELVRTRLELLLHRLAPAATCSGRTEWQRWWRDAQDDWRPATWTPIEGAPTGGTSTQKVIERAFDLRDAGLQVVFVIDTTGSMQRAIDAARDAIDDVSALLAGITPKLELGLVHYKDFGDMGDGARLLEPLTRDHKKVKERLGKLTASGGCDAPERVEKGVEVALDRRTKWDKDANRMLLIVGDAPPHPETKAELLRVVKQAYEHPFTTSKGPVTGGKSKELRPFITSAIATSPFALPTFKEIAAAGGGTAVSLNLGGPQRRGDKAPPAAERRSAAEQIAEHVLLLSFDGTNEAQLREFVRIFFTYRHAGAFD